MAHISAHSMLAAVGPESKIKENHITLLVESNPWCTLTILSKDEAGGHVVVAV